MYEHFMKIVDHLCHRDLMSKEMVNELINIYTDEERHYHNLEHIDFMLGKANIFNIFCGDEELLAILYHDAIYDPTCTDNEARSASLAAKRIKDHISNSRYKNKTEEQVNKWLLFPVKEMIHDTGYHDHFITLREERMRKHNEVSFTEDEYLDIKCLRIMDLDLLGFSQSYDTVVENTKKIRKEYWMYSDEEFKNGRLVFLNKIMERPTIYRTSIGIDNEWKARQNIFREIGEMTDGGSVSI